MRLVNSTYVLSYFFLSLFNLNFVVLRKSQPKTYRWINPFKWPQNILKTNHISFSDFDRHYYKKFQNIEILKFWGNFAIFENRKLLNRDKT